MKRDFRFCFGPIGFSPWSIAGILPEFCRSCGSSVVFLDIDRVLGTCFQEIDIEFYKGKSSLTLSENNLKSPPTLTPIRFTTPSYHLQPHFGVQILAI